MADFLSDYVTDYDESLSIESYIDPVGTLIIWSAFGRQVFQNRINSISNDVRNYTLNLFNHYLVRKLVNDGSAILSKSLARDYRDKDTLNFKHACLIFLENLFVYSVLRHEKMDAVDITGVLGILKARRRWDAADRDPSLVFTHEAAGHILVRQLSLGVSGRYKTPLREIGFFNDNYDYNRPISQALWSDAEVFFAASARSSIGKLQQRAYDFLKKCVSELRSGETLRFGERVPENLTKSYVSALGSGQIVGEYARDFWLQKTGLAEGAAGALLAVLQDSGEETPPRELLERASTRDLKPDEKLKLEHIAELEPFLADCTLLFRLMACERTQSTARIVADWKRFGRDEHRLANLAKQVAGHASLPAVNGTEAAKRLNNLQLVANAGDLNQQIQALANYHTNVMRSRDQAPWLTVEADDTVKVHARTLPRPAAADWPPGAWYNEYYLPQFKNFVAGMRGESP